MEALSKPKIKLIQSLQHKKFRLKYDKFIVEGLKINKELASQKGSIIEEIYVSNPDYVPILQNVIGEEKLLEVAPQLMRQISQMTTPPGVLSVCKLPELAFLPDDITGKRIFYLDSIRDPGNLGTILRIADWFGLDYVICSPDCVDIFNHKVLQASMGSALWVKCGEMEKEELMSRAGEHFYICDTDGKSIYDFEAPAEGIIVLGNESLGVSDEIMHRVRDVISIPGAKNKNAESLNVASAAAVIASWWTKVEVSTTRPPSKGEV